MWNSNAALRKDITSFCGPSEFHLMKWPESGTGAGRTNANALGLDGISGLAYAKFLLVDPCNRLFGRSPEFLSHRTQAVFRPHGADENRLRCGRQRNKLQSGTGRTREASWHDSDAGSGFNRSDQ